jgi:hypothetical protein
MTLSRRDLLKSSLPFMVGAALGGLSGVAPRLVSGAETDKPAAVPELPWPYKKLDSIAVAEAAYDGYYKGACDYGVFEAIIAALRKEVGFPYTVFPSAMMVVGEGGIAQVASVCGALNGAAHAIFLITGGLEKKQREVPFALIQDLYNRYEQVPLPDYKPKNPKYQIATSVSKSNLCHASVSRWCKVAAVKSFSKERSERCAWLTASVAKYTVELLNKQVDGAFKATYTLPAGVKACRACHDQGGTIENTRGMMDCGGCHFTGKSPKHPKI